MKFFNNYNNLRRKLETRNLFSSYKAATNNDQIIGYWSSGEETKTNFGDALNPVLVAMISNKTIHHCNNVINIKNKPVFSLIGSVLDNSQVCNLHIWGSGFKYKEGRFRVKPAKIHAVRGPETRDIVKAQGLSCPSIYGDPALLLPRYYTPEINIKYKLGIIPHYVDKSSELLTKFEDDSDVLIIDINDGVMNVIDLILSCEYVASSSLHGLIVADAYSIPSCWIKFGDRIATDGTKYFDYFRSVQKEKSSPLIVGPSTTTDEMLNNMDDRKIQIDLDLLESACPFIE